MYRLLALLLAIAIAAPSYGFETDVHYGLTYWLARQAGFSPEDARQIAGADQSMDQGKSAPAPWAVVHILIGNDVTDSNLVRKHHFPSGTVEPAKPEDRAVVPGSPSATFEARNAVNNSTDGRSKEEQLWDLGASLHPLQDSWSHQGIPDIPFRPIYELRPQLSYGHPCLRGGWYSHDADLTYLHVPDTVAMADSVYSYLTDYLSHHPDLRVHRPADWNNLKPRVTEFANAASKRAKEAWFRGDPNIPFEDYGRANLTSALDLPESETPRTSGPSDCSNVHRNIFGRAKDVVVDVPAEMIRSLRQVFRATHVDVSEVDHVFYQFLKSWIVEGDLPGATRYINLRSLNYQLMEMRVPEKQRATPEDMLKSWLVEDHGLVNARAHGILAESFALPATAPSLKETLVKFESVENAIEAVQWPEVKQVDRPYLLRSAKQLGMSRIQLRHQHMGLATYIGIFGFKRLDHDVLMVYIGKHDGEWKVDRLFWLAL